VISIKPVKIEIFNNNGELHSFDDKPAIEYSNGDKFWYKNGKLHRGKGPAVEYSDGLKCWYENGTQVHGTEECYSEGYWTDY